MTYDDEYLEKIKSEARETLKESFRQALREDRQEKEAAHYEKSLEPEHKARNLTTHTYGFKDGPHDLDKTPQELIDESYEKVIKPLEQSTFDAEMIEASNAGGYLVTHDSSGKETSRVRINEGTYEPNEPKTILSDQEILRRSRGKS